VNIKNTKDVFIPGLGRIRIKASDKAVTGVQFIKRTVNAGREVALPRSVSAILHTTIKELRLYAQGKLKKFSVPVDVSRVSGFTKLVLQQTKKIPYGRTLGYKQLASSLGSANASRAVGNSLGKNPVPIIIPCHRVIKTDGSLGGYSSGIKMKKKLLDIEGIVL
jgi:methylated-DNA-[protein]-cysteine S-methyltransferase